MTNFETFLSSWISKFELGKQRRRGGKKNHPAETKTCAAKGKKSRVIQNHVGQLGLNVHSKRPNKAKSSIAESCEVSESFLSTGETPCLLQNETQFSGDADL